MLENKALKAFRPFIREKSLKEADLCLAVQMGAEATWTGRINSSVMEVAQEIGFGQRKAYEAVKRLRQLDLLRKGRTPRGAVFFMLNPEHFCVGKRERQNDAVEAYEALEGPCKAA